MSTNRAARLAKTHKTLRKHYKPVPAPAERPVLEHLLYGCCLENARPEVADEGFAKLQESYFDWNEVRVTTIRELADSMSVLPDATEAATRLKRSLQALFEIHYTFDMEFLRKLNQGKAVKELERFKLSPFVLCYVVQNGLGGHAIPTNQGALDVLTVLDVVSANEAAKHRVPGMERAIAKSKGAEFASLLQQFGADYQNSPFSTRVRSIVLEIDPAAKDRLPKRSAKKPPAAEKPAPVKKAKKKAPSVKTTLAGKKSEAKRPGKPTKKSSTKLAKKKPR